MRLVAAATVLPPHLLTHDLGSGLVADALSLDRAQALRLKRIHAATGVGTRHLVLPPTDYKELDGFTDSNRVYQEKGARLASEAVRTVLEKARLRPADVDVLYMTTVTGVAVPSLDAQLLNELDFRSDVVRVPMFGLGCAGGAAGVARMADWLKAHPQGVALLVAVELCSLTFQQGDSSGAHMVATGLFGDGVAAAVMVGAGRAAPGVSLGVKATASRFYKNSKDLMGWDVGSHGFRIILSQAVAKVAREQIAPDLVAFLATEGVKVEDVKTWIAHPGGPKILDAMIKGLGIDSAMVRLSRESLAEVGNLSSASVLDILGRTFDHAAKEPPKDGDLAVLYAMGPGFGAEFSLLSWSPKGS